MFRFNKPVDIVTLFQKSGQQASVRAATLLKQAAANATNTATEDQASDHSHQTHPHRQRHEFKLDIVEEPPTSDQLRTILEYVGKNRISSIINGASDETEAMKKFKESTENLNRPLIVDWNNGKAVASDNESEILKLLAQTKDE
ncbi:DUF1687-domain-containing protein [Xylariaceae sp. FL0804]|nr:DUF1687-domain-containing protein [Xylariaceae sp. FL0804]